MRAAALGTILVADLCIQRLELPWLVGGLLLDEPAHLATAMLVWANLPRPGATWTAGYAAGAVGADADHLPLIPLRHTIGKGTPRPPGHTLLLPAALGAATFFTRARAREALLGAAAGTCVHFLRDLATGTGLAPLRPLVRRQWKAPELAYEAAMALLAARAWSLGR